jgi:hypothetical protein
MTSSKRLQRPQTLADVAEIARANSSEFSAALDEFVDEFYLDHPNRMVQQRRLDVVPPSVANPLIDAWIGAAGEHLAQRWGLTVPNWTQRDLHFALQDPIFLPSDVALRGIVIVESPPAFRSRLIFTRAEPLARARFPNSALRAKVPLQWPPAEAELEGVGSA